MNALDLMEDVKARGASLRVERNADGAAFLVVSPRSLCVDLLPDLARYKPALLELLELSPKQPPRLPAGLLAVDVEAARGRCVRAGLMVGLNDNQQLQLATLTACHWHGVEVPDAWENWKPEVMEVKGNVTQ